MSPTCRSKGWCWLTSALLLLVCACEPPTLSDERERLIKAIQPLCPLFPRSQLSMERLGAACPWPVDTPGKRPCAIEHYLGNDSTPYLVRRLEFDARGRVTRYSDHRDAQVVAARRFLYETEEGLTKVHRFAYHCLEPAPQFYRTDRIHMDEHGLVTGVEEGQQQLEVQYRVARAWTGVAAQAVITKDPGTTYRFGIDGHGNIEWRATGAQVLEPDQQTHNGRMRDEQFPGSLPGRTARAQYAYTQAGELAEIRISEPGIEEQRYRFRYACEASPECARGKAPPTPTPDALRLDPGLEHFSPMDCSEQARHSPRGCDTVGYLVPTFGVECCRTTPSRVSLLVRSPLTRAGTSFAKIEAANGLSVESGRCTRHKQGIKDAWRCAFRRSALAELSGGTARVFVYGRDQQALMDATIDTAALTRMIR